MDLVERKQNLEAKKTELNQHNLDSENKKKVLTEEIAELQRLYDLTIANLDVDTILAAEKILYVQGLASFPQGEDRSCVEDAIKWLSDVPNGCYYKLTEGEYATKNYDRWNHQREDHQYGCGPKHGSTVFAVGFRDRGKAQITQEERNACIYYLEMVKEGKLSQKKAA